MNSFAHKDVVLNNDEQVRMCKKYSAFWSFKNLHKTQGCLESVWN